MLQDLQAEVPDDGRLRLLRELQPAGHADGTLLLELLAELGKNRGQAHAVKHGGGHGAAGNGAQPRLLRGPPGRSARPPRRRAGTAPAALPCFPTASSASGAARTPPITRRARAGPGAVRTGHPRGRSPAPPLPGPGTFSASRRYRCVEAGSMITVTAFTSCSQRLLTCSADMAAPAGPAPPATDGREEGAAGTRRTRGTAAPLRMCRGEGAGGERACAHRAPSRRAFPRRTATPGVPRAGRRCREPAGRGPRSGGRWRRQCRLGHGAGPGACGGPGGHGLLLHAGGAAPRPAAARPPLRRGAVQRVAGRRVGAGGVPGRGPFHPRPRPPCSRRPCLCRIIAVSYEARAFGVTRGMWASEARALCPELALARVPQARGKADLTR